MKKKLYNVYFKLFVGLVIILLFPFDVLGRILFYLSKVPRALGFLFMRKPQSALEELTEWEIWHSIKDIRL